MVPNNVEAATRAALIKSSAGIVSKVVPPTSSVRHSDSPQTEQQRLFPTFAPSHSSMGFPAIQIRFDSDGSALNESWSIARVSSVGSTSRGRSAFLSLPTARCISQYVASQRLQVFPSGLTSLFQIIGIVFISDCLLDPEFPILTLSPSVPLPFRTQVNTKLASLGRIVGHLVSPDTLAKLALFEQEARARGQ